MVSKIMGDPVFVPFDVLAKLIDKDPDFDTSKYWALGGGVRQYLEWPEGALTGPTYANGILVEREHLNTALGDKAVFLPYPEDWVGDSIPVLGLQGECANCGSYNNNGFDCFNCGASDDDE